MGRRVSAGLWTRMRRFWRRHANQFRYGDKFEAFGLKPNECMMVCAAGHTGDFEGASKQGLKTGAVARPDEGGIGKGTSVPKFPVDVAAQDLNDLADKLMA